MNKPYHNDQAHIAEDFLFIDEHTAQTARLAFFKINSYKLSLIKASFSTSREDMSEIIRNTLFNYTDSGKVLADLGFFDSELDN
jgi:rRNA maturation protein Rpf1